MPHVDVILTRAIRSSRPGNRHYCGASSVAVQSVERSYEGSVEQIQTAAKSGESFNIEREKVHGGNISGTTRAKLLTVHIVDKGKPLNERVKQ